MSTALPLSVIILTKNEAEFIARCVGSVRGWADEVLVLDSGSTDGTPDIARALGATVYTQDWLGWSGQRTHAIERARHDWVFCLECDEIVTPELAASLQAVIQDAPDPGDGFYVDRQGDFLGILLPNASRPRMREGLVRLFHRAHSAYDPTMLVHEEVSVPGRRLPLSGALLHWRGYTMDEYIPVFNRYATTEAQILHDHGVHATTALIFGRPILRFFWHFLYRQEWRLGARGLIHSLLKAQAEYVRYAKLWEMQNAPRTPNPPASVYAPPRNPLPENDPCSRV